MTSQNVIVMMSSNVLLFPGGAFDVVSHHQMSWSLGLKDDDAKKQMI